VRPQRSFIGTALARATVLDHSSSVRMSVARSSPLYRVTINRALVDVDYRWVTGSLVLPSNAFG
jgi:hypothetical protein